MKVAILSDGVFPLTVGGIQRHTKQLINYLSLNGVRIQLYSSDLDPVVLDDLLLSEKVLENIEFFHVKKHKKARFPGHYILEQYMFSKYIYVELKKNSKPDIIYAQSFTAWHLLRKKHHTKNNIRVISNFHGLEMFQIAADLNSKLKTLMLRPFVKKNILISDIMFSNGNAQDEIITGIKNKNLNLMNLPIAIESDWLLENPIIVNEIIRFLFVGRFERRRGIEELHKALLNIVQTDLAFEFVFIGDLPDKIKIIDPRIIYLGRVSDKDLRENLEIADILVNPSYAEGMSYAILEAMAKGCAIIASNVGSIPMSVDSGNGWLIRPGSVTDIENSIKEVIFTPKASINVKKHNSISRIKSKFLWDNVIKDYITEFSALVPI